MDPVNKFSDYKLDEHINAALAELGFEKTTPIQERAMPLVLSGQDVSGLAQTGTGKTAAFLLPLFERVLKSQKPTGDEELDKRAFPDWKHNHFNLVLVPTRELAEQVKNCALDFIKGSEHRAVVIYGGVPAEKQIEEMAKGFTFLIATPGRLIDLYKEHKVDLKQVRSVTFDEADRMFDMGFKDDMKYILRRIPENRQFLLFSATLNLDVFNVAYQFGANPVEIKVSQDQATAENVEDRIFHLGNAEKPAHLLGLINKLKPKQIIIFTNFKNQVERIAEFLNKNNHKAVGISSLLTQAQRTRVMSRFRADDGENILVATDVAARGLDVEGVDMVVNFELPDDAENYVHRIGRTGRAGEKGKAFSFVSDKDVEALDRIKKYIGREVETEWLTDEELPKDFARFPRGELIMKKSRTKAPTGRTYDKNKRRSGPRSSDDRKRKEYNKDDTKTAESRDDSGRKQETRSQSSDRPERKRYRKSSDEDRNSKNVHRDKRSGRHRVKEEVPSEPKKKQVSSDTRKPSRPPKKKSYNQRRKPSGGAPATKKPAEKGVLSRLTGAIKGLFQ